MTDDELDEARADEAWQLSLGATDESPIIIAARLAREGWVPPTPVDPAREAVKEAMVTSFEAIGWALTARDVRTCAPDGKLVSAMIASLRKSGVLK